MKRPVMMRAEEIDIYRWKESAKKADITLSEWVRRKCNRQSVTDKSPLSIKQNSDSPLFAPRSKRNAYRRRIPLDIQNTTEEPRSRKTFPVSAGKTSHAERLPIERQGGKKGRKLSFQGAVAKKLGHRYGCSCFACERMREFLRGDPAESERQAKRTKR